MRITLLDALRSKINFFYLVAFAPLVLMGHYWYMSGRSVLSVLIPFYGFLLLFIKKDSISTFANADRPWQFVGLAVMVAGFLAYSIALQLYSFAYYMIGGVFYAAYILGLFLVFFSIPALKESSSAVFLIVSGSSSYYVGEWLKVYMEPAVPYFVQIFSMFLRLLGIPAEVHNPNMITLNTSSGSVPVLFEAGCIGIYSFLVFSLIVVAIMMEEKSASGRTKLLWSIGGIIGTFFINVIRVSFIAVVIYYFGYENWGVIHSWIGYALFLLWLGFFITAFSKKEAIRNKIHRYGASLRARMLMTNRQMVD